VDGELDGKFTLSEIVGALLSCGFVGDPEKVKAVTLLVDCICDPQSLYALREAIDVAIDYEEQDVD